MPRHTRPLVRAVDTIGRPRCVRHIIWALMRFEHTSGETHILHDAQWKSNKAEKRERRKDHRAETPTTRTRKRKRRENMLTNTYKSVGEVSFQLVCASLKYPSLHRRSIVHDLRGRHGHIPTTNINTSSLQQKQATPYLLGNANANT